MTKHCGRCREEYPATTDYFYIQRSRRKGKPDTLSCYCRPCWKTVNAESKLKIKLRKNT